MDMDVEQEIWRLAGEISGIQAALGGLCGAIAASGEDGRRIVDNALRYADTIVEAGSMKLGREQPRAHLEAMANAIDSIRTVATGDGGSQPKGGI
jgi:hypothetical protein